MQSLTSCLPASSLQEAAPLGHAFAGSYFLNPYLLRFGEALSLAATQAAGYQFDDDDEADEAEATAEATTGAAQATQGQARPPASPKQPYHLVRQAHVGMTAILLFARDPSAVHDVEMAHCGFGVADMGNKGAVGLRMAYGKPGGDASELTFVATHLAAMEWNVPRRNANWRSIVSGLTFGNPSNVLASTAPAAGTTTAALGRGLQGRSRDEAASEPRSAEEEAEAEAADAAGDDAWLLLGQQQLENDVRRQLQELSIFRPDSLLFVAGDLNYRIGDKSPPADATFPTADTWPRFFGRDQLTAERLAGRAFHGMSEAHIDFPPTYKYDILSNADIKGGAVPDNLDELQQHAQAAAQSEETAPTPWKYAAHRWPSWCDRVLYLDVPPWIKQAWASGSSAGPEVQVTSYQSLPLMRTSDHQAVYFRAEVPLLPKAAYQRGEEDALSDGGTTAADGPADPRIHLPVAIDTDAWARRARARNRERLVGAGMLLFNTKEGAAVMVTAVVVLVGVYWVWTGLL